MALAHRVEWRAGNDWSACLGENPTNGRLGEVHGKSSLGSHALVHPDTRRWLVINQQCAAIPTYTRHPADARGYGGTVR